jgi:hypothetical protein
MTIGDRLPALDDAALKTLYKNAQRLEGLPGKQQAEAASLVPLIEAEMAQRKADKPPKKPRARAAAPAEAPDEAGAA